MAKSVKIDLLLGGLDQDLPNLVKTLADLASAESQIVKTILAAVKAFDATKPKPEDLKKLADLKKELADIGAKHDAPLAGLVMEKITAYANAQKEHGEDPVAFVKASSQIEADFSQREKELTEDRENDLASVKAKIHELENVKILAAVVAAQKELNYTDSASQKTTSHKIGEADFVVNDLLKTKSFRGQFYVQKDRTIWFLPEDTVYGKLVGEWQDLGKLADTDQLKTQTALQRWCYEFVNRHQQEKTLQENAERVNTIFVSGSPKSIGVDGQCGGTANVYRVVDQITEGQGRQITREKLYAKDGFGFPKPPEDQPEDQKEEKTAKPATSQKKTAKAA